MINELNCHPIAMCTNQLRIPTFNHYGDVIQQMNGDKEFDDFLVTLI